ncbi:MAG: hypothetical protein APF80_03345 [Alphaproteobacteria bacterium BRH_c36]|nr:MAG: hypothetical protein APF80_03345 [Alphaproteobacteria bacterium BRH_c36]
MKSISQSLLLAGLIVIASAAGVTKPLSAAEATGCANEIDGGKQVRCERFALATTLFKGCVTAGRKLSEIQAAAYKGVLDQVPAKEGELRFENRQLGIAMRIEKQGCSVFALSERPADLMKLFDPIEEDIRRQYPKASVRQRDNGSKWLTFEVEKNDVRYVTAGKQQISGQDFALLLYQFE